MKVLFNKIIIFFLIFAAGGLNSLGADSLDFTSQFYSAQELAVGSANLASPSPADAIYVNPAGLTASQKNFFSSSYGRQFDGQNYFASFSLSQNLGAGWSLGLSIPYQTTEAIPLTEAKPDNTPELLGYFSDTKYAVLASLAKKISPEFSLGTTVKWFNHQIYNNAAKNFSVDFGGLYELPEKIFGGEISLGANLKNILATGKTWTSGRIEPVSKSAGLGLAYRNFLFSNPAAVFVALEYTKGQTLETALGAEYQPSSFLIFRAGLKNSQTFLGLGLKHQKLSFDYAFCPHEDLGGSHRVSIGFEF